MCCFGLQDIKISKEGFEKTLSLPVPRRHKGWWWLKIGRRKLFDIRELWWEYYKMWNRCSGDWQYWNPGSLVFCACREL